MRTCFISKKAKIAKSTIIGPYSIIEDNVEIGSHTKISSHVIIRRGTRIGEDNIIHAGAQLGVEPQDYHFDDEASQCIIGDNNIIREYVTISRATGTNNKTIIGNNNFIMTYVHIAHNVKIGNNTVIASGTQIGGYVEIGDFVNIGGLAGIHQFCRIGKYAMLGAKSYLNKDLAPYLLARGNRAKLYGLNVAGLRRNKFSWQKIEDIKNSYRIINRACNITECLKVLKKQKNFNIREITKFLEASKRGILFQK